ncbi:MAG: ubiquitin-conjugating enzyme/RWD-like protein [Monoraphidium minutum]|nr:MAG: ubiquitin-conjugating enzyme/RWD-like protein [Monoraphidium minutum]
MASASMLRLMADLRDIKTAPPEGCSASPVNEGDDLFNWLATILGPADSPFDGGIFSLRLTFTDSYPSRPPRVKFVSEMWHPNVYSDGHLCLDLLQDAWSPCHSVSSLLTSIQSLLTDPNCSSPANPEAAHQYVADRPGYNRRVRRLAEKTLE